MKITITPELVKKYCDVIGDDNPIHSEDTSYGKPVAPGILVTAMISRNPEPYWALAKMNVKYNDAVYVGDTVTLESKILKLKPRICMAETTISVDGVVKQTIELTTVKVTDT